MKKSRIIIMIASFLLTLTVSAHVGLKSSSPDANESITSSPEQLSLTFSNDVRLVKLQLLNAADENVDLDFKPSANAAAEFINALPELQAGEYTVMWTVLGLDGHKMSDSFKFTVSQCETSDVMSSHEDKKSHDGP